MNNTQSTQSTSDNTVMVNGTATTFRFGIDKATGVPLKADGTIDTRYGLNWNANTRSATAEKAGPGVNATARKARLLAPPEGTRWVISDRGVDYGGNAKSVTGASLKNWIELTSSDGSKKIRCGAGEARVYGGNPAAAGQPTQARQLALDVSLGLGDEEDGLGEHEDMADADKPLGVLLGLE